MGSAHVPKLGCMAIGTRVLLIYDGDCRFCRFGMNVIRSLDLRRALSFCPFGEDAAERRLTEISPAQRHDSFHAVKNEKIYSATDAARVTIAELPLGAIGVALGLHNFYPLLAKYRGALGRLVPDSVAVNTCSDDQEFVGAPDG